MCHCYMKKDGEEKTSYASITEFLDEMVNADRQ